MAFGMGLWSDRMSSWYRPPEYDPPPAPRGYNHLGSLREVTESFGNTRKANRNLTPWRSGCRVVRRGFSHIVSEFNVHTSARRQPKCDIAARVFNFLSVGGGGCILSLIITGISYVAKPDHVDTAVMKKSLVARPEPPREMHQLNLGVYFSFHR